MTGIADKPRPSRRSASGLTRPGDLYLPGDPLPQPEVVEKDSDSVWALWSETVEGHAQAHEARVPPEKDFRETVPMDLDPVAPTQIMGLPEDPIAAFRKR